MTWRGASPDPYAVLGVPRTASGRDITRAYRALLRRHHPDTSPGTTRPTSPEGPAAALRRVQDAYALLRDPARRADYDAAEAPRTARTPPQSPAAPAPGSPLLWASPARWDPSPRQHPDPVPQVGDDLLDALTDLLRRWRGPVDY